jgi:cytochrome c oxidase assembly protein subunit 15
MLVAVHIIGVCAVLIAATWLLDAHYVRPPQTPVTRQEQEPVADEPRSATGSETPSPA